MSRFEPAREHRTELAERPAGCLRLVARVAASWDGEWEADGGDGGRLRIPVSAGLHFGWVAGRVTVKPHAGGSEVTFRVEESFYRVRSTTVTVLVLAALGALSVVFAPLVPALVPLVPPGILLSLGAWFFIVARLRNSGPEEFLAALAMEGEGRLRGD